MSEPIVLKNLLGYYSQLHEPAAIKNDPDPNAKKRYGQSFLFRKDNEKEMALYEELWQKAYNCALEFHGKKLTDKFWEKMDKPITDGDESTSDTVNDLYRESMVLRANAQETQPPKIREGFDIKVDINPADVQRRFHDGVLVNAVVDFFIVSNYPTRVCCGLKVVQFAGEGLQLAPGSINPEKYLDNVDSEIGSEAADDGEGQQVNKAAPPNMPSQAPKGRTRF